MCHAEKSLSVRYKQPPRPFRLRVILSGGNVPHRKVAFRTVRSVTTMVKIVRHLERRKAIASNCRPKSKFCAVWYKRSKTTRRYAEVRSTIEFCHTFSWESNIHLASQQDLSVDPASMLRILRFRSIRPSLRESSTASIAQKIFYHLQIPRSPLRMTRRRNGRGSCLHRANSDFS